MTIIQKNGILVGIYAVFSVGTDLWTTGIHPWIAGIVSAKYSTHAFPDKLRRCVPFLRAQFFHFVDRSMQRTDNIGHIVEAGIVVGAGDDPRDRQAGTPLASAICSIVMRLSVFSFCK